GGFDLSHRSARNGSMRAPLWTAHSERKASIRSMRDARRARTAHARRPTPTSANQTSAKVRGSMGLTPYRKPESARAAPVARHLRRERLSALRGNPRQKRNRIGLAQLWNLEAR